MRSSEIKDYLEDVVLDVVDLDLLPGASSRSGGRQQRLESESEEMSVRRAVRASSRVEPPECTHLSEAVISRTLWP